jgi:hypothetical protein
MFEHLITRQGGRCAICRGLPLNETHALAVDHEHRSRKIEGCSARTATAPLDCSMMIR